MKGSMKKLAVFVVIGAIATFIMADMASAGSSGRHAIRGEYAFTGETGCLFSPSGFNTSLQPNAGWGIIQTYSREGKFTFEINGTGSGDMFSRGVAHPFQILPNGPSFPPNAVTQDITFDFTYTLTNDGKITIIVDPGTFISTQLKGPDAGRIFVIDGVLTDTPGVLTPMILDGAITPDGKIITLNGGAPDVYVITRIDIPNPPPPNPNYSICRNSGVLIWQHDIDHK
jgi:hypothetical protein